MTDKTLDQSDLKFLEDGKNLFGNFMTSFFFIKALTRSFYSIGDAVKVDESLFQHMDLDEDDDPDFDPNNLSDSD